MPPVVILYVATTAVFFLIDQIWLGVVARDFYRDPLGCLMADQIVWPVAIPFYLLLIAGLIIFAVAPAIEARSWTQALVLGAAFGFFAYATYDLTNLVTLRDWPPLLTVVDIAWETVLGGSVASAAFLIGTRLLDR